MSLLHNFSLAGSTSLHKSSAAPNDAIPCKPLRKAKSHSFLNNPLIRLVRDPVSSIEAAIESIWAPPAQQGSNDVHKQSRRQILIYRMKDATDHQTWRAAAEELDELEGNNAWKSEPASPLYDYQILQMRLQELQHARISRDPGRMLWLIRNYLTRSLGDMGDLQMYKYSHIGTKYLIEDYITNVCDTLETFLDCYDGGGSGLDPRHVYEELLRTRQYFGRSALMLSGGGTFGMTHSGVIKTLWENNLLPRIISGSSAGSIIASVVCARTDEELPDALDQFCTGDLEVFEREAEASVLTTLKRLLTTFTVFDAQHLIRVMRGHLGDITFLEAYNRTRRILNVSVSSTGLHELPRLLNYVTAPNVLIWSAVVASCSVPVIFSPVTIMEKDPMTGEHVKWNPSQQYMDGSVDNDLPMTRLSEMFNVNHFIVAQVNPHVIPFLDSADVISSPEGLHTADQTAAEDVGIWNMVTGLAKSEVLHRMHQFTELGIAPTVLTKFRSVMSQKYSGDITIVPEIPLSMIPRVLRNPDPQFMRRALLCGERATWPKLSRIQNHLAIELAIDTAIARLSAKIAFSPSQVNLRLLSLDRRRSSSAVKQNNAMTQSIGRLPPRSRVKNRSWCADQDPVAMMSMSQQLQERTFDLHPDSSLEKKLRVSAIKVVSSSVEVPDSGSDSEDENEGGAFFMDLSKRRKRGADESSSVERLDRYDSATSVPQRSRTPSPADDDVDSPDPGPSINLWPVELNSMPNTPFERRARRKSSPSNLLSPPIVLTTRSSVPEESADQRKWVDLSGTRAMMMRKKVMR